MIKATLLHYLQQLQGILSKVPDNLFKASLAPDMLSLEVNAKVACNFALRGYCPLVGASVVSFDGQGYGREALLKQLRNTINYLSDAPDVESLDNLTVVTDKAGFEDVSLPESEFVHLYILPNFMFHLSMVYATARANGVKLGKADFDGLHQYPPGFNFVTKPEKP